MRALSAWISPYLHFPPRLRSRLPQRDAWPMQLGAETGRPEDAMGQALREQRC